MAGHPLQQQPRLPPTPRATACVLLALLAIVAGGPLAAVPAPPAAAVSLAARYATLKDELTHNQFQRPIHIDSTEGKDRVSGEIFALVNSPFATVGAVLDKPANWCEILFLHLNNKYCRPSVENRGTVLRLMVGAKGDQALKDAYRVDFLYRVSARTADYLRVDLDADEGPMSTRNYRIVLEATPTDDNRTFIHFSYAYSFGVVGRFAMQAYLNTVARNKVGFSAVRNDKNGTVQPVDGMRGAVERNTMRYYLAIEAFLGALSAPPGSRVEKSLRDWFASTEAYAKQLHEMDQGEYLAVKRREYSRQQADLN
ncbi:MAG: hypothetical protein ABIS68_10560 [Casimicrobiaceae bacterium]